MAWENLTDLDRSWIAGIFEGEGTIGVWERRKDKKYPRILIYNNDVTMLEEIQRLIGGIIYERKWNKRKPNWKVSYSLTFNKKEDIQKFLQNIFPFIRSQYKINQVRKII